MMARCGDRIQKWSWRCALALVVGAVVGAPETRVARGADRPRLVVVVSIDQMCAEYLERFRANLAEDGFFRRVEREGASYIECHHRHAFTLTGPGHAVLMTGAYPSQHGIISNEWYDRRQGKIVYCVEDPEFPIVGSLGETELRGVSPRTMDAPTVGDVLQAATAGQAKIFGITLKDRAAVLMAGQKPDGVFWYDSTSGCWVTSRYYGLELPDYLMRLNLTRSTRQYAGRFWTTLLPAERYRLNHPDESPFEESYEQLGKSFPYRLTPSWGPLLFKQLPGTPFGNEHTLAAARLVVRHERLGSDETPDILALGLSSNDYVGHYHGPHSIEVEDMVLRTDRLLAQFTEFLDQEVGRGKWTILLSADHAVAPIPEYAETLGLPAKRNPLGDVAELVTRIEAALVERFGPPPAGLTYLEKLDQPYVFLRRAAAEGNDGKWNDLKQAAAEFMRRQPGVLTAATRDQILDPQGELPGWNQLHRDLVAAGSDLATLTRRSFHAERSGEVVFLLRPYQAQTKLRATHGSPWRYDTHVPLLLLGNGIRAGRFERPTSPASIAATVARLVGVDPPSKCVEPPAAEALQD